MPLTFLYTISSLNRGADIFTQIFNHTLLITTLKHGTLIRVVALGENDSIVGHYHG